MADLGADDPAQRERDYSPSSVAGGSSAPWEAQYRRRSAAARDVLADRTTVFSDGTLLAEPPAAGSSTGRPPLFVFVHGGYWQALSAAESFFLAADLVPAGWAYAAIEYTLAPRASLDEMVAECSEALARLPTAGRSVVLVGHSAGAHLVAMAALTSRPPVPIDRVVLVSGVFDLRPLVGTSIAEPLSIDVVRAADHSPALAPVTPHPDVVVAWGEIETTAFDAQSRSFADHLRRHGAGVREFRVAGRNHFDVLDALVDPSTDVGRAVLSRSS
jgi:arylformamidase